VNTPNLLPNNAPESKTNSVCNVKGTGVKNKGMRTNADKVVKIMKTATAKNRQIFLLIIISLFKTESIYSPIMKSLGNGDKATPSPKPLFIP